MIIRGVDDLSFFDGIGSTTSLRREFRTKRGRRTDVIGRARLEGQMARYRTEEKGSQMVIEFYPLLCDQRLLPSGSILERLDDGMEADPVW